MARHPHQPVPLTIAAALNLEHAHGQGILRGIARAVSAHPNLLLLRFSHTRLQERGWLGSLDADGLIVKVTSVQEARLLEACGRPVVDTAAQCAAHRLVRVTSDNLQVGEIAAEYYLRRGFRQLAYVGIRGHGGSELRQSGFVRAATRAGLPCARFEDEFDAVDRKRRAAVSQRLLRWIEALPLPGGIFCHDDPVAAEVLGRAIAAGRRVPTDLAILGCNNDPTEVKSAAVELSSIELNTERIGYDAVHQMLAWLTERRRPASTLLAPLKLVTRGSTERFAVSDPAVLRALEFIHGRMAGTFSVEDVARAAAISRRLLEMRFRRQLGYSIYAEVQRLRLERAVGLMADRGLRLAEVAQEAGFSSSAKLSAAFRARHRISPRVFRAQHFGRA